MWPWQATTVSGNNSVRSNNIVVHKIYAGKPRKHELELINDEKGPTISVLMSSACTSPTLHTLCILQDPLKPFLQIPKSQQANKPLKPDFAREKKNQEDSKWKIGFQIEKQKRPVNSEKDGSQFTLLAEFGTRVFLCLATDRSLASTCILQRLIVSTRLHLISQCLLEQEASGNLTLGLKSEKFWILGEK